MNSTPWLAALLTAGMLSACVTPPTDQPLVNIRLNATKQNTGQIAQASLAAQGEVTGISFFIGGVPQGVTRPVRLYTFVYPGRCGHLGPAPAYAMNQTLVTQPVAPRRGWSLAKSVPVALDELRAGGYTLVVRTTAADGGVDIFCGDIN